MDEDSFTTGETVTADVHVKTSKSNADNSTITVDDNTQKADVEIKNEKVHQNVNDIGVADINATNSNSLDIEVDTNEINDSLILTDNDELQIEMVDKSEATTSPSSVAPENPKNASLNAHVSGAINEDKVSVEKEGSQNDKKLKVLWVNNLSATVKAADLKEHLTRAGKVNTVKIVTDGKRYYGYVVMDKIKDANECLKLLNGINFEGRKIFISCVKPTRKDIDEAKDESTSNKTGKVEGEVTKTKKRLFEDRKKRRVADSVGEKHDAFKQPSDKQRALYSERELARYRRNYISEKRENARLKYKILRLEQIIKEKELKKIQKETKYRDLEFQLDRERKKFKLELEVFEKERREFYKIVLAKRELEKEKTKMLETKNKLAEEVRLLRFKHSDEFNLKSKHLSKADREYESKYSCHSYKPEHGSSLKKNLTGEKEKHTRSGANKAINNDNYDVIVPPPPPKFHADDGIPTSRQSKPEHDDRKMFVNETYGKKRHFIGSPTGYPQEMKKFRSAGGYSSHNQQITHQRTSWNTSDNHIPWKATGDGSTAVNSGYQETHYYGASSSSLALGANYRDAPTARVYSSYIPKKYY